MGNPGGDLLVEGTLWTRAARVSCCAGPGGTSVAGGSARDPGGWELWARGGDAQGGLADQGRLCAVLGAGAEPLGPRTRSKAMS